MKTFIITVVVLVIILAGLYFWLWQPSLVSVTNSPSPTASKTISPSPTAGNFCYLKPQSNLTAYARPSKSSPVYGQVTAEDQIIVGGVTADGWIGFDPAAAQAPNVGPFRLRWIEPDADYMLDGNCGDIPDVVSLPPLTCYTMAQTDIPIYKDKSATSTLVATMHSGDYTKVIGRTGTSESSWVKVDLSTGSLNKSSQGWIKAGAANYNGADCSKIPTVS